MAEVGNSPPPNLGFALIFGRIQPNFDQVGLNFGGNPLVCQIRPLPNPPNFAKFQQKIQRICEPWLQVTKTKGATSRIKESIRGHWSVLPPANHHQLTAVLPLYTLLSRRSKPLLLSRWVHLPPSLVRRCLSRWSRRPD
jgi:hypothetical protein